MIHILNRPLGSCFMITPRRVGSGGVKQLILSVRPSVRCLSTQKNRPLGSCFMITKCNELHVRSNSTTHSIALHSIEDISKVQIQTQTISLLIRFLAPICQTGDPSQPHSQAPYSIHFHDGTAWYLTPHDQLTSLCVGRGRFKRRLHFTGNFTSAVHTMYICGNNRL